MPLLSSAAAAAAGLGAVFAAGDNSMGQLGLGPGVAGTTDLVLVPLQLQQVPGLPTPAAAAAAGTGMSDLPTQVLDIAAGLRHSLALVAAAGGSCGCNTSSSGDRSGSSGLLFGWGSNKWHQLCASASRATPDAGVTDQPLQLHIRKRAAASIMWLPCLCQGLPAGVVSLAAGGDRSAAVTMTGGLLVWGRPLTGMVPKTAAAAAAPAQPQQQSQTPQQCSSCCEWPQPVPRASWLLDMQQQAGQLGCSSSSSSSDDGAIMQLRWVSVGLGWRHVVALDSAGQVWSAGDGSLGQLGCRQHVGPGQLKQQQRMEVAVQQLQQLQQQQQQQQHSGVAASSGACDEVQPCLVELPAAASCAAAGAEHSVAVLAADCSVWAWGWGEHGQVGTGSTEDVHLPQQVLPAVSNNVGVDSTAAGVGAGQCWRAAGVACGSGFTVAWGQLQ